MSEIIMTVLAALSAVGGGAVKGLWDEWRRRRASAEETHRERIETSGEIKRAEIEAAQHTESRLWERVDALERKLDGHHQYCDERIDAAITRSEAECEDKINRKLRSQAAQLRKEFRRGLEEFTD